MRRREGVIDRAKPAMKCGNRAKLELRCARPGTALAILHLDRESAAVVHHREAVLIGGVVAGIDRAPAGEGWFSEESGDRRALVAAARLKLDHLAPKNDT